MKSYFISYNGLYSSFDFAIRKDSLLFFYRKLSDGDFRLFTLDLLVSRLKFTNKYITVRGDIVYYFEIVPVGVFKC